MYRLVGLALIVVGILLVATVSPGSGIATLVVGAVFVVAGRAIAEREERRRLARGHGPTATT